MSDVTEITAKNPNAKLLRDEFEKKWQSKLAEQAKKTATALQVAQDEMKVLTELREDYEAAKVNHNAMLKFL